MHYLIFYFLIELYLSLKVGENIGFLWSVIWILMSVVLGMALLQKSQYTMMANIHAVQQGKLDIQKFKNAGLSYVLGAILLMIPGVFSDLLGIGALVYTLYLQFVAKITPEDKNTHFKTQGDDNVIDVEIISEHGRNDLNT